MSPIPPYHSKLSLFSYFCTIKLFWEVHDPSRLSKRPRKSTQSEDSSRMLLASALSENVRITFIPRKNIVEKKEEIEVKEDMDHINMREQQ